ncbi:hypothetical protein EES41_36370 [Streptomyces sp. ADI95-16]|nr:hypothetical protein EES41_36370 [Streptomyces sp. ADI95-16]
MSGARSTVRGDVHLILRRNGESGLASAGPSPRRGPMCGPG